MSLGAPPVLQHRGGVAIQLNDGIQMIDDRFTVQLLLREASRHTKKQRYGDTHNHRTVSVLLRVKLPEKQCEHSFSV